MWHLIKENSARKRSDDIVTSSREGWWRLCNKIWPMNFSKRKVCSHIKYAELWHQLRFGFCVRCQIKCVKAEMINTLSSHNIQCQFGVVAFPRHSQHGTQNFFIRSQISLQPIKFTTCREVQTASFYLSPARRIVQALNLLWPSWPIQCWMTEWISPIVYLCWRHYTMGKFPLTLGDLQVHTWTISLNILEISVTTVIGKAHTTRRDTRHNVLEQLALFCTRRASRVHPFVHDLMITIRVYAVINHIRNTVPLKW